ncbi:MAG: hypothetical protein K2I10_11750 [Lachnospiraceae bacterium]|nr:hypothetical protein [Lachnospiraceae bacterium]
MENDSKEIARAKHENYEKAREKAKNMSKSFLDMCIKEGLTIFELKMIQDIFPNYINNKIEEILQKTKLS